MDYTVRINQARTCAILAFYERCKPHSCPWYHCWARFFENANVHIFDSQQRKQKTDCMTFVSPFWKHILYSRAALKMQCYSSWLWNTPWAARFSFTYTAPRFYKFDKKILRYYHKLHRLVSLTKWAGGFESVYLSLLPNNMLGKTGTKILSDLTVSEDLASHVRSIIFSHSAKQSL